MTRWHVTIMLSAALTLCAFECQMSVPGTSLPRTPETEALHAHADVWGAQGVVWRRDEAT